MEYILWSGLHGAPKMELKIDDKTKGTAHITQPVSPPVNITLAVHGTLVNIGREIHGLFIIGDQTKADGPCCGAAIVAPHGGRLGEPAQGIFWWIDAAGLHESGMVPAWLEVPAELAAV